MVMSNANLIGTSPKCSRLDVRLWPIVSGGSRRLSKVERSPAEPRRSCLPLLGLDVRNAEKAVMAPPTTK
jgi:hypothetical protein